MARTSIWRFAEPLVATVLSLLVLKHVPATQRFVTAVAVALGRACGFGPRVRYT